MHLLRKQKKKEKKYALQMQKRRHKESQAVRAGSVRPRGLAVMIKSMHLNQSVLPAKPAAGLGFNYCRG